MSKINIIKLFANYSSIGKNKTLHQGFSTFILSLTQWQISEVKFTPNFFLFSLLQMSTVVGKSMNFLLQNLPPFENPYLHSTSECRKSTIMVILTPIPFHYDVTFSK